MNANIKIAGIILILLLLWFLSGVFTSPDPTAYEQTGRDQLTRVQVNQYSQRTFTPELSLPSKTEPYRIVELKAQVSGLLLDVPGRRGLRVEQGQPVCVIEPMDRPFRVDRAAAQLEQAQIAYRGALQLKTAGYQSEFAIAKAKADLESAKLILEQSEIDLNNLRISAPFTSIIETRPVEIGDFIAPGQLCARLVELDPIKVTTQVSEADISKLKLGEIAVATFFNHNNVNVEISYIAHEANASTRTYLVEAIADNPNFSLRAGMSGRLKFSQPPLQAHLIPASLIVLDAKGEPSVRGVDENNLVKQISVTVVGETEQGLWVEGLPEEVALITVGQNYVSEGEVVDVYSPPSE